MPNPIVVGVDGSASSLDAVDLAVREAAWRHLSLRVVHAFAWPYMHVPLGASEAGPPEGGLRRQAEQIVSDAVDRAERARKVAQKGPEDLPIAAEVIEGFPAATLIEEARGAAMVVVGSRGLGGFLGLMIGSVALQLTAHAACPVLVRRGRADPSGPVVVGFDGSPSDAVAAEFAFAEADVRGSELVALSVWSHPTPRRPGDMVPLVYDPELVEADARTLLATAVAEAGARHPRVRVVQRTIHGRPRRELIDATAEAQLIVVGSQGRGAAEGLLLGSVSQAVLRNAACPVAIVPRAAGVE